jgi:hypothetical protein
MPESEPGSALPEEPTASQTLPQWYVVKTADGTCQITPAAPTTADQFWGPFASPDLAIARRVGLIRAGQCQPQQA